MELYKYKDVWNARLGQIFTGKIKYDNWLDDFKPVVDNVNSIIDLGCGLGNNSLYFFEKGKKDIIACDYAEKAIEVVKKCLPEVKTMRFDITDKFPIEDNSADILVADLCLHYFDFDTTNKIISEIKRVLKKDAYLALRVNSVNDINHGAMQGKELEYHYFFTDNMTKRFFDKKDIESFFKDWKIKFIKEERMGRYLAEKVLWKVLIQK